jgi:hypothetical protein
MRTDGQTDMKKLIVTFRNFDKSQKLDFFYRSRVTLNLLRQESSKHFQLNRNQVSEMLRSVRTATWTRLEIQLS